MFRWIFRWSPWMVLLQWHSNLLARITSIPLWLFGGGDRKNLVENGIESGRIYPEVWEETQHLAVTTIEDITSVDTLKCKGSTSTFSRLRPGVILKSPRKVWEESSCYEKLTKEFAHKFSVERKILEKLGDHPRVVKYLGHQDTHGLRLAEASHGSLQQYIDQNNHLITLCLRKKWCRQTVESIVYIHSHGVIHSDLRPDNFLVHATSKVSLDLWLCDFGGSMCAEMDLDGGHLPDPGFFDPTQGFVSTAATDIFSLGSVMYTILTGHWPHRPPGPFKTGTEMDEYEQNVDSLFSKRVFPEETEWLVGGKVVMGCWTRKYGTAEEILNAFEVDFSLDSVAET